MIDEDRIKADFKRHLQRDVHFAHDLQYCHECGRSIVGRGVRIERTVDGVRWLFLFCQVDHVPESSKLLNLPDEPFKVIEGTEP